MERKTGFEPATLTLANRWSSIFAKSLTSVYAGHGGYGPSSECLHDPEMPLVSDRSGTKVARKVGVLTICSAHVSASPAPLFCVQRVTFQCEGLLV